VMCGLAAGIPLLGPNPIRAAAFAGALDLGVLAASFSVTSPHTIHPGANPASLRAFADALNLQLGGDLARLLNPHSIR